MKNTNIKSLIVVHENLYTAKIDSEDIISFYEDNNVIKISLTSDYQYEDNGLPRWKAIQPFDKDEITSIQLEFQDGSRIVAMSFCEPRSCIGRLSS